MTCVRVPKKWSDPTILSLVLFAINDGVNSETGVRPLDAMFGSEDSPYFRLPDSTDPSSITSAWVRGLDEDLRHIRAKSLSYSTQPTDVVTRFLLHMSYSILNCLVQPEDFSVCHSQSSSSTTLPLQSRKSDFSTSQQNNRPVFPRPSQRHCKPRPQNIPTM